MRVRTARRFALAPSSESTRRVSLSGCFGCALRVRQLRERATRVARELLGGRRVRRGSRLAVGDELFEKLALSAERESLCTGEHSVISNLHTSRA